MANEKRLISLDMACSMLNRFFCNAPTHAEKSVILEVKQALLEMASTEVVRCKDCSFIIDRSDGTHGCYRHFVEDCKIDDFCSYGERKDNG